MILEALGVTSATAILVMEVIGWISAIAFSICGAPQAWKCIKEGHADGLSLAFLHLWYTGELLGLMYVIGLGSFPLMFNYALNVFFVSLILRYKIWKRKERHGKDDPRVPETC